MFGAGSNYTNLDPAGKASMGMKKRTDYFLSWAGSLDLLRQGGRHFLFILWIPHRSL